MIYLTAEQKIKQFAAFEPRWSFGEGETFSEVVIEKALALNRAAVEAGFETDAFPGLCGEIDVTVYRGDDDFDFCIEKGGLITLAIELHVDGLNLEDAIKRIKGLRKGGKDED